jgi:hypothetical protein
MRNQTKAARKVSKTYSIPPATEPKEAERGRTRKGFLCDAFAALRLCVKVFAFSAMIETAGGQSM